MRPAQRGWVGLIAILIALVIVAVLAQTVLRSYGLLGGGARAVASNPAARSTAGDAPRSAPAVTAPMERARALEGDLTRGAEDLDRRIDEQTK